MNERQTLLRSFGCALQGIFAVFRRERNVKIQLVIAGLALILALILGFTLLEWCLLVLLIAAVLAAEIFNSAIERTIDLVTDEFDERARYAKDVAAGAVLLLSIAAAVCGLLLYWGAALRLMGSEG